jgi:uncharacterized oligopeptide transporter (OPT) family protein
MDALEKREKALIIWEEQIRLIPTDVQVQCAIWDVQPYMREVAEELVEYLRAARAFPKATKNEVFFEENK